jgi:hypothetical protein
MTCLATFAVLAASFSLSSCGSDMLPDNAPKLIDADGSAYVACEGFVWVSTQDGGSGGASYSVKFTEKDGVSRDLRGIRKLDISDVPKGFDPCKPLDEKIAEKASQSARAGTCSIQT